MAERVDDMPSPEFTRDLEVKLEEQSRQVGEVADGEELRIGYDRTTKMAYQKELYELKLAHQRLMSENELKHQQILQNQSMVHQAHGFNPISPWSGQVAAQSQESAIPDRTSTPQVHYAATQPTSFHVPLPRQTMYDGAGSWEGFIEPFKAMAMSCGWPESESLFRLKACVKGDAAEYVFRHLSPVTHSTYLGLVAALAERYQERQTVATYLARLEMRRLESKEGVSHYVADLKSLVLRGYPTADEKTRDTITLRHFLKGLPDPQTAIEVGMREPRTVEEARAVYETYVSLCDDLGRPPRVRMVQAAEEDTGSFVTQEDFDKDIKAILALVEDLKRVASQSMRSHPPQRSRATIECHNCHTLGHYARECGRPRMDVRRDRATTLSEN